MPVAIRSFSGDLHMDTSMKPACIPNELPQKFLLIWMCIFLVFWWVLSILIPLLLPEKVSDFIDAHPEMVTSPNL